MKQTQTKVFEFSDVGLDFCGGSKNLFPDRFKKMLASGYNEQTVTSVAVVGDQVTLTYGGAHGYVADRVLKIDSGDLATINEGEFWIDSVTTNTVTFTLDDAPTSISPLFTTRIASLGWELMYEVGVVHVYRFKHIDDTYMFARLLFAPNGSTGTNFIMPSVGKTYDPNTGIIDDPNAYQVNAVANEWAQGHKWLFEGANRNTHNNYTYSQGASTYGNAVIIGSIYHLVIMSNIGSSNHNKAFNAIVPCHSSEAHPMLNYPFVMAPYVTRAYNGSSTSDSAIYSADGQGVLGNFRVVFDPGSTATTDPLAPTAAASLLPSEIDGFNTTTATPIYLYERTTRQAIGLIDRGIFICQFASSNTPATGITASPSVHYDLDTSNTLYVHPIARSSTVYVFFAVPVEDIKNG